MDQEPQPAAAPTDGVAQPTQPVESAQQPAAQPQEPTQSQPAQADDTAAWLQSKGVDPNDPEAFQKVAQMAYHSEKQMTKATQEASELRRSLTPEQPVIQEDVSTDPVMQEFIQDYKREKMLGSFKEAHPDWQQYDNVMGEMIKQPVQTAYGVFTRGQLVNAGIISLDDIYTMAKGASPVDTAQVKQQAQQEVLQTLANTQRAGGGTAQASNPNPQANTEDPVTAAIRKSRG